MMNAYQNDELYRNFTFRHPPAFNEKFKAV